MKKDVKFRLVAFLLPVLMIIQAFFLASVGNAEDKKSEENTVKEKYSINLDIKILEKTDKPSARQVKVWKLKEDKLAKNSSGTIDELETAKNFDKLDETKIKEALGEALLTSEESKITENGENERISIEIEQAKDEVSYYLIKESDDSYNKMKDRIDSGKSEKLNTTVIKVPSDQFKEKTLDIQLKGTKPVPPTDIVLVKKDTKNKDRKIEKVDFRLLAKSNVEGKKDYPVILEQKLGYYEFKAIDKGTEEKPASKETATIMSTNAEGKIVVKGLPKGESFYFEEIEAKGIYNEFNNISNTGKHSDNFTNEIKEEIVVYNDRIPFVKKKNTNGNSLKDIGFKVFNKDGKALKFKEDKGENIGDYGYGYIYDESGDIEEVNTDDDGNIFLGKMPAGEGYYFLETKTPDKYEKSEEKHYFNVDENGVIYLKDKDNNKKQEALQIINKPLKPTGGNEKKTGGRKFIKVEKNNSKVKIKGAKFKVVKKVGENKYGDIFENKKIIVESDENGRFEVKDLPYEKDGSTYYLIETAAPGYVVNSEPIPFTINANSYSATEKVIENVKEPPKEETPPPTPVTPPSNPPTPVTPTKTIASRSRGPMVKTGDIRIWIYFAIGLVMIIAGSLIIRSQDKKQQLA